MALRHLAAQHRGVPDSPRDHWFDPFPRATPRGQGGCPVPEVILRRPGGTLEVFLREPRPAPPAPWVLGPDPRIWVLPENAEIPAPRNPKVDGMPGPSPALVQLGATNDGSELYVDLEAIGVLAIDAPAHATPDAGGRPGGAEIRGIARAMTATLAASPLAGVPTVKTIGFDPFGLAEEERVSPATSIDDLVDASASWATYIERGLREAGAESTFALRALEPGDNWDPVIAIIAETSLTDADADRLEAVAGHGGRGVAVVLPASPTTRTTWRLVLERSEQPAWRLDPVKITVTPLSIAAEELEDLTALLAEASTPPAPVAPSDHTSEPGATGDDAGEGDDVSDASSPARTGPGEALPEPDWRVMLRLLGPVDVIDQDGRRPAGELRDRTLEAIAWLVTHRRHATRTDLIAALWPNGVQSSTVTNVLGHARNVLAQLAGREAHNWIPAYQSELRIHPALTSDLDQVQGLVSYAERNRSRPEVAVPALRKALELVRGTPAHYWWLDAELGSTLTTVPVAGAVLLAELCLERGDVEGVLDAAGRGLALLPAHGKLFALRMRACAASGDLAGVRAEYDAYVRAEQDDPFYDGETDRTLQQLHQDLLRSGRAAG
jgi:hypothetical protein